jgi:hypothetical protein
MRAQVTIAAVALLASLGCGKAPTPAPNGGQPSAEVAPHLVPGTFRFTPKNESTNVGPVGTGLARCGLYVYEWAPSEKQCKVQVNHCEAVREGSEEVRCLSLADERTLSCGGRADACGQQIECVCPTGDAEKVQDAPGTVHVTPTAIGQSFESNDRKCQAKVTTLGAEGPPPAPCILGIHECPGPAGACLDRTQMLSCGIRSEVCGHPVKCDCP